jgi:hypothetical protein
LFPRHERGHAPARPVPRLRRRIRVDRQGDTDVRVPKRLGHRRDVDARQPARTGTDPVARHSHAGAPLISSLHDLTSVEAHTNAVSRSKIATTKRLQPSESRSPRAA